MAKEYSPVKKEVWWCENCDERQVDSTKPETGTFYMQCGCKLKSAGKIGKTIHAVIYAHCTECDK